MKLIINMRKMASKYFHFICLNSNLLFILFRLHLNLSFGRSALKHSDEKIDTPIVYCNISGNTDADRTESKDASDFIQRIIKQSIDVELAPLDTTGLLAAQDSLLKIRESRRSSLRDTTSCGLEEVETNNMLMAVKESLEIELDDTKKSVEGSVNFQNFDAIRIPDQLEIKKSGKTSRVSRIAIIVKLDLISILIQF